LTPDGTDPLLTRLPVWDTLGKDERARQAYWRQWVHTPLGEKELAAVRRSVVSSRPFGSVTWTECMARLLGIRVEERKRGWPKKVLGKMK
jgi:hypothetical protein